MAEVRVRRSPSSGKNLTAPCSTWTSSSSSSASFSSNPCTSTKGRGRRRAEDDGDLRRSTARPTSSSTWTCCSARSLWRCRREVRARWASTTKGSPKPKGSRYILSSFGHASLVLWCAAPGAFVRHCTTEPHVPSVPSVPLAKAHVDSTPAPIIVPQPPVPPPPAPTLVTSTRTSRYTHDCSSSWSYASPRRGYNRAARWPRA